MGAERVVVGLPLSLDGTQGPAARRVLKFVGRLRRGLAVPVDTWDERFSTVHSQRILREAGIPGSRRKKSVDSLASAIILQGYLDSRWEKKNG